MIIKVRNQELFIRHTVPPYKAEHPFFNIDELVSDLIVSNGMSRNADVIVYEIQDNNTIKCLGIDDGYEDRYNRFVNNRTFIPINGDISSDNTNQLYIEATEGRKQLIKEHLGDIPKNSKKIIIDSLSLDPEGEK